MLSLTFERIDRRDLRELRAFLRWDERHTADTIGVRCGRYRQGRILELRWGGSGL